MRQKKAGAVAFIIDSRISREKRAALLQIVYALQSHIPVDTIHGDSSEEDVLKKLNEKPYVLVIAPWYRYLVWKRVEALFGLTRTSGPTCVGYFCEPLSLSELGSPSENLRLILMDFATLSKAELMVLLLSVLEDTKRAGILPLLDPNVPIYCENWFGGQGLGWRIDCALGLPEIAQSDWNLRANALRICLNAFWSLIYEQGPGKSELRQAITKPIPKAYFQLAAGRTTLVLRLVFHMPSWSPLLALREFWPDPRNLTTPAQLLGRYADFVRVHSFSDTANVEVVAGFVGSAPAEGFPQHVRTLWVEPLSSRLLTEGVHEMPGPTLPRLREMPTAPGFPENSAPAKVEPLRVRAAIAANGRPHKRLIHDAVAKIRELKTLLLDRESFIRELRAGGIGTAQPLAPPDTQSLLQAFQERYFQARFQIRQFELQIAELEEKGANSEDVERIRKRMLALMNQERGWIKIIGETLEAYRRGKTGSGSS